RRASGRVRAWSGSRRPLKTWRPKIDPPAHAERARIYRTLRQEGHDFGPAFRGVQTLWREHGEALGLVTLPEEAGGADHYLLHPALLDACFHVIRVFEAIEGKTAEEIAVTLPFAI